MNKELSTTGEGEAKLQVIPLISPGHVLVEQDPLLERAARLNKLSEVSQVALGMCLAEIKRTEAFRPDYEDFKDYYSKELGRTKGDISKLLTVGRFMLDNGFPEDTEVGYTKLYIAQSVFEGCDPQYILSEAQTNPISAMLENSRDAKLSKDHEHVWEVAYHCTDPDCGKFTTNQQNHV